MIWKLLLWPVHHILVVVLLLALWLFFGGVENRKSARNLGDGQIEFAPSRIALGAGAVIVIFLVYQCIVFFKHSQGGPLNLFIAACPGLLAIAFLCGFPGTVIIGSDGLQQIYWFWRSKRICWEDIVEINTGKKIRTVTITGANGTKIVHSRQLADRTRLLLELKRHCGENLPPDFP